MEIKMPQEFLTTSLDISYYISFYYLILNLIVKTKLILNLIVKIKLSCKSCTSCRLLLPQVVNLVLAVGLFFLKLQILY